MQPNREDVMHNSSMWESFSSPFISMNSWKPRGVVKQLSFVYSNLKEAMKQYSDGTRA